MWAPALKVALLGSLLMIVIAGVHGENSKEKKVTIHIPTDVKHIHHHHTSKVVVTKPQRGHSFGGHSMKGFRHGKHLDDWQRDHHPYMHHDFGGYDDMYDGGSFHMSDHGSYHKKKDTDDIILGSRSMTAGLKHDSFYEPSVGFSGKGHSSLKGDEDSSYSVKGSSGRHLKDYGSLGESASGRHLKDYGSLGESASGRHLKDYGSLGESASGRHLKDYGSLGESASGRHLSSGSFGESASGKLYDYGSGSGGSSYYKFGSNEGKTHGKPKSSIGRYEVNEDLEDEKRENGDDHVRAESQRTQTQTGWRALKAPIAVYDPKELTHSTKAPSVSSYDVKGHKGTSYSSVVLHSSKDKRQV